MVFDCLEVIVCDFFPRTFRYIWKKVAENIDIYRYAQNAHLSLFGTLIQQMILVVLGINVCLILVTEPTQGLLEVSAVIEVSDNEVLRFLNQEHE